MQSPLAFLRAEAGAVTVDYVVLLAGATGVALVVLTAAGTTFDNVFRVSEEELTEHGYVAHSWGDVVRSYQPTNPVMHASLVQDFSQLSDDELDTLESFVNAYINHMEPLTTNDSDTGMLNDLDYAMSHAYVTRLRERPHVETPTDVDAVGAIAVKLGWDGSMSGMFAAPVTQASPSI